jgi:hypothetical protein
MQYTRWDAGCQMGCVSDDFHRQKQYPWLTGRGRLDRDDASVTSLRTKKSSTGCPERLVRAV